MRSVDLDAVAALQELADQRTDFVVLQVLLRRHGNHQPAGEILREPRDLIGKARDIVLGDVGEHLVVDISAGSDRLRLMRARHAARIDRFVEMRHLHQLVLDVGGAFDAVVFSGRAAAPISTSPNPVLQT